MLALYDMLFPFVVFPIRVHYKSVKSADVCCIHICITTCKVDWSITKLYVQYTCGEKGVPLLVFSPMELLLYVCASHAHEAWL